MVENDVKEDVDGVKDEDLSAAEQPTNGDEAPKVEEDVSKVGADDVATKVADEVTDNGPSSDEPATTDAVPAPASEPVAQIPETPAEEEAEKKTEEQPERNTTSTESAENTTTNNSV